MNLFEIPIYIRLINNHLPLVDQLSFARCNKLIRKALRTIIKSYHQQYNDHQNNCYKFNNLLFVQWLVEDQLYSQFSDILTNACHNGALNVAQYVINAAIKYGRPLQKPHYCNALDAACRSGSIECINLILKSYPDNVSSFLCLRYVYESGSISCINAVEQLIKFTPVIFRSQAYLSACIRGNIDIINMAYIKDEISLLKEISDGINGAAEGNHMSYLKRMILKAKLNKIPINWNNAFTAACNRDSYNCAILLIHERNNYHASGNAIIKSRDIDFNQAFITVCVHGSLQCFKLVISLYQPDRITILEEFTDVFISGNLELIQLMFDNFGSKLSPETKIVINNGFSRFNSNIENMGTIPINGRLNVLKLGIKNIETIPLNGLLNYCAIAGSIDCIIYLDKYVTSIKKPYSIIQWESAAANARKYGCIRVLEYCNHKCKPIEN